MPGVWLVLFEADDEAFLGPLAQPEFETFRGFARYPAFIRWLQGRCFPDFDAAYAAFLEQADPGERLFGPDRDERPGVTLVPQAVMPAQVVEFEVESSALRSRSRGLIPAVVFRIVTDDGAGLTCSIAVGDELVEIHENIATAMERAVEDVAVALRDGVRVQGSDG